MTTSTDHLPVFDPRTNVAAERRFYPRAIPSTPIYVAFGPENLGVLQNVSENGLLVATPNALALNSVHRVFICLDGTANPITVHVRTVWTVEEQKRSGIQLLDLSEEDRDQIRTWASAQPAQNRAPETWLWPPNSQPQMDAAEPAPARGESDPHPEVNAASSSPVLSEPEPGAGESASSRATPSPEMPGADIAMEAESAPETVPSYTPVQARHDLEARSAALITSRSSRPTLALWTAAVLATACSAAGWHFRHSLAVRFAPQTTQMASATSPAATSPSQVTEVPAPQPVPASPPTPDNSVLDDVSRNQAPSDMSPDAPPANSESAPDRSLNSAATDLAAEPASEARVNSARPASGPVPSASVPDPSSHSHVTSGSRPPSKLSNPPRRSFPVEVATESPRPIEWKAAVPIQPQKIRASQPQETPVLAAPPVTAVVAAPSPTRQVQMVQAPSPVPPSRSAISGSIAGDPRSNPSATASSSPLPASASASIPQTSAARVANSSGVRNFVPPSSPVIQMDAPQPRVTQVIPPGTFTAAFVELPGERVFHTTAVTVHMQRSVKVPGDRWRWPADHLLWRNRKKVELGELSARVDPQIPQSATTAGSAAVQATIDKDGYVSNIKPLYGSFALLPNAEKAVREWRYKPTYLDNKPVETQAKIEIEFHPPVARNTRP
jgi:hypothetical protein